MILRCVSSFDLTDGSRPFTLTMPAEAISRNALFRGTVSTLPKVRAQRIRDQGAHFAIRLGGCNAQLLV